MNRTLTRITLITATATLCGGALLGATPVFAASHSAATVRQAGTTALYLHLGSSGEAVRSWQQDVNLLSALAPGVPSVAVDGVYGPQTAAATRDMQRYSKVGVDGIVGPRTRAAMDRAIHRVPAGTSANLGNDSVGPAVREWQTDLNRLAAIAPGLKRVAVDGIFGRQTAEATLAFQHYAKIGMNGVVTAQVRMAMAKAVHRS